MKSIATVLLEDDFLAVECALGSETVLYDIVESAAPSSTHSYLNS